MSKLNLDDKDKKRLWDHCNDWFTRQRWFLARYSGIGFVGFGDADLFPTFSLYNVESYICGTLKSFQTQNQSAQDAVSIFPLAQDDIMQTVIAGVHPQAFASLKEKFLAQLLVRYEQMLTSISPTANAEDVKKQAMQMAEADFQSMDQSFRADMFDKYTRPRMEIVASLPKDELALMAETLVNITSYMRRVSSDLETVGGPTDVAVISKKDGFIWIKRKYYFDADHNYHFFTDRQISSWSVMWAKEKAATIAEIKSAIRSKKE